MKLVLKGLVIVLLAALGAGMTLFFCKNCPERALAGNNSIDKHIENYINNNSQKVFEAISKNEDFGMTVRNFSAVSDAEIEKKVKEFLDNNAKQIFESYIEENVETFKVATTNSENVEDKEETKSEANPENQLYIDNWDKLSNSDVAPFVGPKDAKVTIVEFFDFNCGHCKALAPVMAQLMKNNPDVKFVFQPLYFMSEHSPYAAKVSLAAFKKGKFAEVFEGIMTLPEMNEETINQILVDEGLNVEEIKKMIEEKEIRRGVQDIDSLSQVMGINGVPMLIINAEPFPGRSYTDLQNKINSLK
jgi:protein-disulfide isomerase